MFLVAIDYVHYLHRCETNYPPSYKALYFVIIMIKIMSFSEQVQSGLFKGLGKKLIINSAEEIEAAPFFEVITINIIFKI